MRVLGLPNNAKKFCPRKMDGGKILKIQGDQAQMENSKSLVFLDANIEWFEIFFFERTSIDVFRIKISKV